MSCRLILGLGQDGQEYLHSSNGPSSENSRGFGLAGCFIDRIRTEYHLPGSSVGAIGLCHKPRGLSFSYVQSSAQYACREAHERLQQTQPAPNGSKPSPKPPNSSTNSPSPRKPNSSLARQVPAWVISDLSHVSTSRACVSKMARWRSELRTTAVYSPLV